MSDLVVCKFGGSSVANATQIEKVRKIVTTDPQRRIVVVSAPGRLDPAEQKLTDHLINIATDGAHFRDQRIAISSGNSKQVVVSRFEGIVDDLGIDGEDLLTQLRQDLDSDLAGDRRVAFLASRGEHYNARLIAAYFDRSGTRAMVRLPEDFGFVVNTEYLDARLLPLSYEKIASLPEKDAVVVVPGFYGVTEAGDIAVFSRGGSDLTGSEIAYAVDASRYENWTDVSGVFEADPRLISKAQAIPRLTFKEIRLLSSKGFNVFHLNAMLPCRQRKIPIHIRNTNRPGDRGTLILSERVPEEGVVGIARLDNVAYIYLQKDQLGEEIGFTAELLRIFQDFGIQTYHYPTDKDDIAVVVNQNDLTGTINDLRRCIEEKLEPDFMDVFYNLSILTPVGMGLKGSTFPMLAALTALGEANIPIEMVDLSPSQICFHIGVQYAVGDAALQILYDTLIG